MSANEQFSPVFDALRSILAVHPDRLNVRQDTADYFAVDSLRLHYKGRPVMFGAVRTGKNYVSFHLMPVYMSAQLRRQISPELSKRMQGKACFNFKKVDATLFQQLAALTEAGLECFEKAQFELPGIEVVPRVKA
jgi:hypothetical protein